MDRLPALLVACSGWLLAAAVAGCDCSRGDDEPSDACAGEAPRACYEGPQGRGGVGACVAGLQSCVGGRWGDCVGDVAPADELCDGIDQDCDGEIDDGVTTECGCQPCIETLFGASAGGEPFVASQECLVVTDGELGLAPRPVLGVLWIELPNERRIVRADAATRQPIAAYATGDALTEVTSTAVGRHGEVYLAVFVAREPTRFVRIDAFDCLDRDGDGVVTTSTGVNDVLPLGQDECLRWANPRGGEPVNGDVVVYDATSDTVWAGLESAEPAFVELDAEDGAETGRFADLGGCTPVAAAQGPAGDIWVACANGAAHFAPTDSLSVEFTSLAGGRHFTSVDEDETGRIWLAGGPVLRCAHDIARGCDEPDVWAETVVADHAGGLWLGACQHESLPPNEQACRLDGEDQELEWLGVSASAIDLDVWQVPWVFGRDETWSVDPVTLETSPAFEDCEECRDLAPPTIPVTERRATRGICPWTATITGCPEGATTRWGTLSWDVAVAPGEVVRLDVRVADTAEDLAADAWSPVSWPRDGDPSLDLVEALGNDALGRLLELRVWLSGPASAAGPRVHSLRLTHSCG